MFSDWVRPAVAIRRGSRAVRRRAVRRRAGTVYGRAGVVPGGGRGGRGVVGQPGVAGLAGPAELAGLAGLFGFTEHVGLTNLAVSDRNFLRLIADTDSGLGHDCSSLRSSWWHRRHGPRPPGTRPCTSPASLWPGAASAIECGRSAAPARRRLSRRPRTPAW